MKNLELITKMTIKYEFKFPDGRTAWQEMGVSHVDIVSMKLRQAIDAAIGKFIEDNPLTGGGRPN